MDTKLIVTLSLTLFFVIWFGIVTDFIPTSNVFDSKNHPKERTERKPVFKEAFGIVKDAFSMWKRYLKIYAGYLVSGITIIAVTALCVLGSGAISSLIYTPRNEINVIRAIIYIVIGGILPSFIISPLIIGLASFFMKEARGEKASFKDLFSGFSNIFSNYSFLARTIFVMIILYGLVYFIVNKCILMGIYDFNVSDIGISEVELIVEVILNLIVGIVVLMLALHYNIVPFVMADKPYLSTKEAVETAKMLMQNVKKDYIKTIFIVGLINIVPVIFALLNGITQETIYLLIAIVLEVILIPFNILSNVIFYEKNSLELV